jgi:hypothetical protein
LIEGVEKDFKDIPRGIPSIGVKGMQAFGVS